MHSFARKWPIECSPCFKLSSVEQKYKQNSLTDKVLSTDRAQTESRLDIINIVNFAETRSSLNWLSKLEYHWGPEKTTGQTSL